MEKRVKTSENGSEGEYERKDDVKPEASEEGVAIPDNVDVEEQPQDDGNAASLQTSQDEQKAIGLDAMDTLFEGAQEMLQWIKSRVQLPQLSGGMWTSDHDTEVLEFLSSPTEYKVIMYVASKGLVVQSNFESMPYWRTAATDFMYFIRPENKPLTITNIGSALMYGRVGGLGSGISSATSLLRVMSGVYMGQFKDNASWPESVRKDFAGQVHKFMATLTEITNQARGKTVLYVPAENIDNPDLAADDKDLVQRLESTMIRWTRQIKEVVNNQDMVQNTETSGPLEEIQFWRSRTQDLSGISEQLERPGVKSIMAVTEAAKSSYLGPFKTIADMIQRGSIEANDNLKFLLSLQDPCTELSRAEPKDIPRILPGLLACIRMIWTTSRFYNTEERLTGLLRKVSNEIIYVCCSKISLNDIFDGDVEDAMVHLNQSIQAGVSWKKLYKRCADAVAKYTADKERHWNFDIASIFAQVDAFVQRCRDLLEVCEGQIQFARKSSDFLEKLNSNPKSTAQSVRNKQGQLKSPLPVFGGTRGPEVAKQLIEIEEAFDQHIEKLKKLEYDILDVKATRWHDDYNHLKSGMKDLEVMTQNVINSAFEGITNIAALVDLLESFSLLAKREAIKRCVLKKTADVFNIMTKEIDVLRHEFDSFRSNPPLGQSDPKYAGAALWARGLLNTVQRDWDLLQFAHYLPKTREAEEARSSFDQLTAVLDDYTMKMYQDWMSQLQGLDQSQMQQRLEIPLMSRVSHIPDTQLALTGEAKPKSVSNEKKGTSETDSVKDKKIDQDNRSETPSSNLTPSGVKTSASPQMLQTQINKDATGYLVCNFHKDLMRLFEEVNHWGKFQGEVQIPYVAHDVSTKRDDLRVMREHVMLVVRDYNTIIHELTAQERRLFQEHIRRLDRRIAPGLSKLTWASKGVIDWYVRECRKHCADTQGIVADFKVKKAEIERQCKIINSTMLVSLEKNHVYEARVFAARQEDYRRVVESKLRGAYETIISIMNDMYNHFKNDPLEVQREWMKFQATTDRMLGDALRQTAKKSLQELSHAINGDAKTEPQALFKVNVVLQNHKVAFQPTMIQLTQTINRVSKDLINSIKVVPRVSSQTRKDLLDGEEKEEKNYDELPNVPSDIELTSERKHRFYDIISNDEDILKILVQIMNGMSACATELQKYLTYWDKYRTLWDMDKDAFIRRYAKANRQLSQYDKDITRYREQQSDIQSEDIATTINFIKIECVMLKGSLVQHCMQWQSKLTGLLNQNALVELEDLHSMFEKHSKELSTAPLNLDELSEKIILLNKLKEDQSEIESRFGPLEAMYQTLSKFEVQITDNETQKLSNLWSAWDSFKRVMEDAETSLAKSKQSMKKDLEMALNSFNARVENYREEVVNNLPIAGDKTSMEAFESLNDLSAKLKSVRDNEERLKPGLAIFNIDLPDSKELKWCEIELDVLTQIWTLTRDWQTQWKEWKDNKFDNLVLGDMEQSAAQYNKSIGKLGREKGMQGAPGGAKKFGAYQSLKELIDQFRQTLPLIQDLKNPAIRPRHWDQLKEEISKEFDPFAETFTLSAVFSLGLHMHGEFISEMSANANKEMAIEEALVEIAASWEGVKILMGPFKEIYWKVLSTEEMFAQLEDNQVSLSTMKASKFFLAFQTKIEFWEKVLSSVSEVVDLLLQVQRQWMYLESIFMASEDIKKQLPTEAQLFDEVNGDYKQITQDIVDHPIAKDACTKEGVLTKLTKMDEKLEKIQKSLDQYLETKRQAFPRFYFLSNDDLLEILGQQKDPTQVQKHIKKCFVGVNRLVLVEPGKKGNKTYEADAMISNDGEKVPLVKNCIVDGPVECWLNDAEARMFDTVAKQCGLTLAAFKGKKEKWIKDWPGQLLITVGAISWTAECTRALETIMKGNNKSALKQAKKKQVSYLNRLSDMVRGNLTKLERSKIVALITMELHNRDVQERMIKANTQNVSDFEWLCQLRFYWNKDEGEYGGVIVRQTNQEMEFGYEYQGNNGRLVVTPLTDRCVLTLVTALALNRGGAPAGPAGTGKTETVKDLGKNLAKYVVVFNCSDSMDYKSVGRMFSGLVQTGGWGCFDEFNRIQIEVLSVIAQQVMSIMGAIAARQTSFNFMGIQVRCRWSCGIFITMNPGYAGRTALPDNLSALFRPVSMMVPDLALIAEVMLASEGFKDAKPLAKKTTTLYALMIQQLSKQDHYDFGLRSLRGVLMCAGALKREDASVSEELILLRALRDMNVPKFIREDMELFMLLINDLFPGMETPPSEQGHLQVLLEQEVVKAGYQLIEIIVNKAIQLYESKCTRHCNMLVGKTLAGKSVTWRMLEAATTSMCKEGHEGFQVVRPYVLNPKSVSMDELYGAFDLATFEWADGILSNVFRACAQDEKPDEKWIVLDGPVDTLWIESMNTVMDDNKTLTLINGDRINMSSSMSLLFEVRDLSVASPATVSRAGMIYLDVDDLGYEPYIKSWAQRKYENPDHQALVLSFFEKYCKPSLLFKMRNVAEPVPITDFNAVRSLCNLFDSFATKENGVCHETEAESFNAMMEKWFLFCFIWSVCAAVDTEGRKKMDGFVRDIDTQFPPANTIYDYFIDVKSKDWKLWEDKVPNPWRPQRGAAFFEILVPTIDTVRNSFVSRGLIENDKLLMIVGDTGTGKTVITGQLLENLLSGETSPYAKLVVNFSSATNSLTTQEIIEGSMEKRSKDKFGPPGGKQLICFVDDFNMPQKDTFGSQPPLELLRQWIDYDGWYERAKQTWRYIQNMQLVVAMGPPGGGRSVISGRLQSRFNVVNFTPPVSQVMERIFASILTPHLLDFDDEVKGITGQLVTATIGLYEKISSVFLPTPAKCHYLFNLRDVAKVIQGLLLSDKSSIDTKDTMLRLWIHECSRVFCDRFINDVDIKQFQELANDQLSSKFSSSWANLTQDLEIPESGPKFSDFLSEPVGDNPPIYEEITELAKMKIHLDEKLEDYNMEPGYIPMDLVLFKDALGYIMRIARILRQPRGNIMLVGMGGSGRQSLTRLSAYACEQKTFSIEITKQYRAQEFHEDLKSLYMMAGGENKPTTFLFSDTQLKEESFLEDINNMLSSGEVPNLFGKDEKLGCFDAVRPIAKKKGIPETADKLWELFIDQTRNNLHIVLAMSPTGEEFRDRCRMYPALVSSTTIIFFHPWPADALKEVASKFLEETKFSQEKAGDKGKQEEKQESTEEEGEGESTELSDQQLKPKVGEVFALAHQSVTVSSSKMLLELKRHNYVTPTAYLELVKSYRELLEEKLKELSDSRAKLSGGLTKLEEGKVQVEEMSVELEKKKIVVAQAQKDCEELLVVIVAERRSADERKKQVEAQAERIGKEEVECKAIAADAEEDLGKAIPALETAMAEVDKLDKSSISEVKAYASPPPAVEMVLSAVMILFNLKTDWATAKKKISEANFLQQIKGFDKDNVTNKALQKVSKYTKRSDFNAEQVKSKSSAAAVLCTWVLAIELYSVVFREVAPKRARLKAAMDKLATAQSQLKVAQEELAEVIAKVEELNDKYQSSVGQKNALREEAEGLEMKLDRADKLVSGLAGERVRWEASIAGFDLAMRNLVGDVLIAAAFLSYAGPFDSLYRSELVAAWLNAVKTGEIPHTDGFEFAGFLAKPTDVRNWNLAGLPSDEFSTENGVITTRGRRWPLMIDPQGQGNKWVKNGHPDIVVCNLNMPDFLRKLETALQFGTPYLMQDVEEELDPSIEPVLTKSIIKVGNRKIIKLGDKEIDYAEEFRFFVTTKLGNPHYTPEVSTKVTLINFSVKLQGLDEQLLGEVVKQEEPALEAQKADLVVKVASGKNKLVELENNILKMLAEAEGSLLEDEELVKTLGISKKTSEEVTHQLKIAQETEIMIDATRQGYRPVSIRAAILYFILNDLASVDPMYQFSLNSYVELFNNSIERSRGMNDDSQQAQSGDDSGDQKGPEISAELRARINQINNFHTYAVYAYACRGLFEKHKLLLSMQICFKTLQQDNKLDKTELDFLLKGAIVLDRTSQKANPGTDFLSEVQWDNIVELDKNISVFQGLVASFEQNIREWRTWYLSASPETESLPGDWDNKLTEFQRILVVRSLRLDRALSAASNFVSNNIGARFVEPPPFDLNAVFESSVPSMPLIFVLSPGVDPTKQVYSLAESLGKKVGDCSLGQGQAPVATKLINEGLVQGNWVFLANCHLAASWLPSLEKIIEDYCEEKTYHKDYRLWLSSSPTPKFPLAILQRGLKMTTEPPKGLKANLRRLYDLIPESEFERCAEISKYKKLLFCLAWFHSVLLERRKFLALGWNVPYDFNDPDFLICENIIAMYIDEYPDETPWDAIRYLVAQANYGGRITDDWDRRLCIVYVNQLFNDDAIEIDNFRVCDLEHYYIPDEGNLDTYKAYIGGLPLTDDPVCFGQHPNADISSMMTNSQMVLDTLLSLQPRVVTTGGQSNEDKVLIVARDLAKKLPDNFDLYEAKQTLMTRSDPDPLKSVLMQEIDRYNILLSAIRSSLKALELGIQGLTVITAELEEVFNALLVGKVPAAWSFCYPSLKPLGSWMRDLIERIEFFQIWLEKALPKGFWLSGFTYPTGFLTGLLQTTARKNTVSIDVLSWEFPIIEQELSSIQKAPEEGAYIYGMFLEGAKWDHKKGHLIDPAPLELISDMPMTHFKPVENKKKNQKGIYNCPCYLYPIRTGSRERPSYMITVDVKSGEFPGEYWVKKGSALLLSTGL